MLRYIFKMRIGCDGSFETMNTKGLISGNEGGINCNICNTPETR